MTRLSVIGAAAVALMATLPRVTDDEARARGLLPMGDFDRPPPMAIPKPDNPMALLGKHAGRMRKGKRLWRA